MIARHLPRVLVRQAVLLEHVGDLGLRFARALVDLLALVDDLRVEDLALALAADVLAGGHAEDAAERGGDAGHDDEVVVLGRRRRC